MTSPEIKTDNQNLSTLLQLESMARKAESEKALHFLIVNETRRLLNYRQAFLVAVSDSGSHRVEAASSLSVIDRNAPVIGWLEDVVASLAKADQIGSVATMDASTALPADKRRFEEFSLPFVLWSPLLLPDGRLIGGIWLARETPWQDNDLVLIERLCETWAHAWGALLGTKRFKGFSNRRRAVTLAIVAGLVLVSLIPVRLSAIAPAEIVPSNPSIISAPMDGVIEEVVVPPNTPVKAGDVIFRYEDTNLRNAHQIAKMSFNVADARLRKATQGAFQDAAVKGQVSLLQAERALKETELEYASELLQQIEVTALSDGLLVYSDESDWVGKPVAVGERIMEVVDPNQVQFRIDLAVDDAIVLTDDAEVQVFLHADPLTSIKAKVTKASFNAYLTPANVLAYRVEAAIIDEHSDARIGLQGTARIYGTRVSLIFYVLRRPISALRQSVGL